MDYRRLVYFLFTNFITFSTLIMVVLLIILQKKTRESEVTEKIEPRDLRPDQMRKVSSSLSDIGLIAGLSVLTVLFLSYFTIPVLRDIPYLVNQSYVEYEGIIVQNSEKEITVEVAFENDEPEKVEISGTYSLQEGEKIILEYLPHMKMRINWYVPDTDSFE